MTHNKRYISRLRHPRKSSGFTIVELLVVIVVIAILAAITIVAYRDISQQAIASSLSSDLDNASKQLKLYQVDNGSYPTALDCSSSPAISTICLKVSNGTTYTTYQSSSASSQVFCLTATKNGISYRTTNDSVPIAGTCSGILPSGMVCPVGFIVAPGNTTFGTSDFCIMKYEAKNNGSIAVSRPDGTPWTLSQTAAISTALAACSGCHLVTEAEWMTLVANVLSVPSNWSGGVVGSGYVYQGHINSNPASALAASSNDGDGLNGISGGTGTAGTNSRRTLTLTNGEVIWDLVGNVWEWTNCTIAGGAQPGLSGETAPAYKEYNNPSLLWNGFPPLSRPSAISPTVGSYSSAQAVGRLYSNYGEPTVHAFLRGGGWSSRTDAGVLTLRLDYTPSGGGGDVGFRVSR